MNFIQILVVTPYLGGTDKKTTTKCLSLYAQACSCVCMHLSVCVCAYMCVCVCVREYVSVWVGCACTHTHVCVCECAYMQVHSIKMILKNGLPVPTLKNSCLTMCRGHINCKIFAQLLHFFFFRQ